MSERAERRRGDVPERPAATLTYTVVCVASLAVLFLVLIERDLWPGALLPVAVGGLAVALRLSAGVPLFLLSLGGLLFVDGYLVMEWSRRYSYPPFDLSDLLLCAAVFTFVAGTYRLAGLTRNVFPRDPRRLLDPPHERVRPPANRSPEAVAAWEVPVLFLTLPVWVGLAQLAWVWLLGRRSELDLADELWRYLLLLWLLTVAAGVAGAFFSYLRQTLMSPAEAALYLQDVQWEETRQQQRLLGRWLAWARGRRRRGGKP